MTRTSTLAAILLLVAAGGAPAQAPDGGAPGGATPAQYFTFELPAGTSLISSPLDGQGGRARDHLLGLPPHWALFRTWDSATQRFVDADALPMRPGSGYWTFLPSPTEVIAVGSAHATLTPLTRHIEPGWHLFGVPFTEGIAWRDFQLFASGNPVGLARAAERGWLVAGPMTVKGSEWSHLEAGDVFQPGAAYWIRTTVPLDVRAVRRRTTPLSPDRPLASGTSESVVGWLGSISESMVDVAKGGAQIAEGHWAAGTFEFLAAGFGLLEYGIGFADKDPIAEELAAMDAKLDLLIGEVGAISTQLGTVLAAIEGLNAHIEADEKLGQPMRNAETWLDQYYLSTSTTAVSREWARWVLAGCTPGLTADCPSETNPVTTDNYNRFVAAYIQHPGQTTRATDDFPYWWANSVIGNQIGGVSPYLVNGTTADGFVTLIKHGLLDDPGTSQNGLVNYMEYVLSQSPCAVDVSSVDCDLFDQVYLPLESYFAQAVGDQAQLVEAVAESWGVLAQKDPTAYGSSVQSYMSGATQMFNQEIESFLQVSERLAMYEAASGVLDWNTFPSSQASQLLARADFVAMRLGVLNTWLTPPISGYVDPPWPVKSGVVGRVLYVNGQATSASRDLCDKNSPDWQDDPDWCWAPTTQLAEVASSARTGDGPWPYLQWQASGSTAVGTPTFSFTVQRLAPTTLAVSSYAANSSSQTRGTAQLTVEVYDEDYNTPAEDYTGERITFGSFSSLEGMAGRYALGSPVSTWSWSGCDSNSTHSFAHQADATGVALQVNYPSGSDHLHSQSGSCTGTATLEVNTSALLGTWKSVHFHWPGNLNVSVSSKVDSISGGCDGNYWLDMGFTAQLADSKGNVVGGTTYVDAKPCGTSGFNSCSYSSSDQSLHSGPVQLTPMAPYTLKMYLHSKTDPEENYGVGCGYHREAVSGSAAYWVTSPPTITLTKD